MLTGIKSPSCGDKSAAFHGQRFSIVVRTTYLFYKLKIRSIVFIQNT